MMRKKCSNKKVLVLIMSLTLLSALLGTSYASWSKTTIVDTHITSGKIAATGKAGKQYIICTNVTCESSDSHRQQPSIQFQLEQDSIPIEVRKVEILEFKYTAEIWGGKNVRQWIIPLIWYIDVWEWDNSPTYQTITLTDAVKNIPCTYQKGENNRITILLEDLQIKNAMPQVWTNHRPDDRTKWADVYVGNTGKLTFRITYTQFNTKDVGGWEKTMDVEVPVSWYRRAYASLYAPSEIFPENGKVSIRPGEESQFK